MLSDSRRLFLLRAHSWELWGQLVRFLFSFSNVLIHGCLGREPWSGGRILLGTGRARGAHRGRPPALPVLGAGGPASKALPVCVLDLVPRPRASPCLPFILIFKISILCMTGSRRAVRHLFNV